MYYVLCIIMVRHYVYVYILYITMIRQILVRRHPGPHHPGGQEDVPAGPGQLPGGAAGGKLLCCILHIMIVK